MTLFKLLKCACCFRWSCPNRYKVGNRTYYSYLGFVKTECPKKLEKDPFYRYTQCVNEQCTKERLEEHKKRMEK